MIISGSTKDVEVFYNVLSNVGTRTAILYIKNILANYQVRTSVARDIVQNLPFSVVYPTPQILEDLDDLVSGKIPLKDDVRTSTILGYATLVYLTFKNPSVTAEHPLEWYVDLYYNKLLKAETYNEQLIWLHGLRNIELGGVFNYLTKIIKNDVKFAVNVNYDGLREQAIWGLEKYVSKHQQDVYNLVWPIVIDSRSELAHRVAALQVYVVGIKTVVEFEALVWFMQYTHNPQFYRFFTTLIKSYQTSANHCSNVIAHFADTIEIYSQNFAMDYNTEFYSFEEYDAFYGVGGKISGVLLADNVTNNYNSLSFKFEPYMSEQKFVAQEFYMKFGKALDNPEVFQALMTKTPEFYKDLFKTGFQPFLEYAQFTHTRASFVKYYDFSKDFEDAFSFKSFLQPIKKSFWTVSTVFDQDRIFFTEIGLPLSISFRAPLIVDISYNSFLDLEKKKYSLDFDFKNKFDGHFGLRFFNQYSKLWGGVARVFTYKTSLPISFAASPDNQNEDGLRFTVDTTLFDDDRVPYLRTFTETRVYLEHETDVKYVSEKLNFDKYYSTSRNHTNFISTSEESFDLYDEFGFGLKFSSQVETYPEANYAPESTSYTYKFLTTPWDQSIITWRKYILTHLLAPDVVASSHDFEFHRVGDSPVTKIYFTFDHEFEEESSGVWFTPHHNHQIIMNFTIEREDEAKNTFWETKTLFTSSNGEILSEFSFEGIRSMEHHPYYLVGFKYDREVTRDSASGSYKFAFEEQWSKELKYDQYYLNIDWTGSKSSEQLDYDINKHFTYKSCEKKSDYLSKYNPTSYSCIYDLTSLRYYVYNVEYNLPDATTDYFRANWGDIVSSYLTSTSHAHTNVNSGLQVEVAYPFTYDRGYADITINYPNDFSEFLSNVYHGNTPLFDYDSTYISPMFNFYKQINIHETCHVKLNAEKTVDYSKFYRDVALKSNEYVKLLAIHEPYESYSWSLWARNWDGHGFDVKFELQNYTSAIEIDRTKYTTTGVYDYNFIFDSKFYFYHLTDSNYHSKDVLKSKIFKFNNDNIIAVPELGLVVIFDHDEINISYIGTGDSDDFDGECTTAV